MKLVVIHGFYFCKAEILEIALVKDVFCDVFEMERKVTQLV